MRNKWGFTNERILDRMDTLADGPEAEQRLMHFIKQQGEIQVCKGVWMIAYEDGTYGYRTEPKSLFNRLPDELTDFLCRWGLDYGRTIDDSEDEPDQGSELKRFYGE